MSIIDSIIGIIIFVGIISVIIILSLKANRISLRNSSEICSMCEQMVGRCPWTLIDSYHDHRQNICEDCKNALYNITPETHEVSEEMHDNCFRIIKNNDY